MTQRVILMFEPDTDHEAMIEILRFSGTEILHSRVDPGSDLIMDIPDSANISEFMENARAVPGVHSAEQDIFQFAF